MVIHYENLMFGWLSRSGDP